MVLLDRVAGDPTGWCSVSVDDREGGDLAVTHLLEQGHTRIGFVGGPDSLTQVADRREGGLRRCSGSGWPPTPRRPGDGRADAGRGAPGGQRVLGLPARRRPTAVFCANDLLAIGVLQQMLQHGVDVPGEMAIVGYDDIEFAAAAAVPLSSVSQPRYELGRRACQLLLAEAEARTGSGPDHVHKQVEFSPELVVRASSMRMTRPSAGPRTQRPRPVPSPPNPGDLTAFLTDRRGPRRRGLRPRGRRRSW